MYSTTLVQAHFDAFQSILGIFLTNRCNVTCGHCGTNSGPSETSHLGIDAVLEKLEGGVQAGIVKGLHINGGEPFLFRSDVGQLALAGQRLGILVGVNTNAFWAPTVAKASEVLKALPGLTQLMISTDSYHEEAISLEKVKNAAVAALEAGLSAQIAVCTIAGEVDDTVTRVRNLLGPALLNRIPLGINPVEPVGRAVFIEGSNWRPQTRTLPRGRCSQINRPVILEDGIVLACCNTCVARDCLESPLNLGSIETSSIQSIHDRASKDYIVQAIRVLGPKYLAELLIEEGHAEVLKQSYPEGDICDLCASMMSKVSTVRLLTNALSSKEKRREIAIARAVECDEMQMLFQLQDGAHEGQH